MKRVVLMVLLSIAVAKGDDKDNARFSPGAASSYPGHQTNEKITIAAVPYITEEQTKTAFGKVNPNKYGVQPVLVVIQNDTGKALRLDLEAQLIQAGGKNVEATPPLDVTFIGGDTRAPRMPGTSPLPIPLPKKKGPLNTWEIEGRAFNAHMIPPGESASGFFYFQISSRPGAKLYLNGLKDAASGKDYFYFEVPLADR